MDNTILLYNNALSLNLKQTMSNVNDVLYNMQSLKQFQWDIDQVQKMKDGAQMQVNMAALALLRNFILDEDRVGIILFRNLIRKYYPLSDNQIVKYEKITGRKGTSEWVYVTNLNVVQRKGNCFWLNEKLYKIDESSERTREPIPSHLLDLFYDITSLNEIPYLNGIYSNLEELIYSYSGYVNFLDAPNELYYKNKYLASNIFTKWEWRLIQRICDSWDPFYGSEEKYCKDWIPNMLQNNGFFAQMGINNIKETLNHLQEFVIEHFEITEEMRNEVIARLEQKGIALYSYLPIAKDFILQHQNELDWKILQKNPSIQWDWELINLYLRKVKETVSENEWDEYLLGSKAMYAVIENYLNDEILNDIEKLYDIVNLNKSCSEKKKEFSDEMLFFTRFIRYV